MYVLHLEYNFKIGCLRPHASAHTLVLNEESLSLTIGRRALFEGHTEQTNTAAAWNIIAQLKTAGRQQQQPLLFLHSLRAQSSGCALKINTHITRMHATGAKNEEWTRAMLRADEINFALPRRESIISTTSFPLCSRALPDFWLLSHLFRTLQRPAR